MAEPTVNWITGVIFVPKSYLDLVQASPTEIYNLDLNKFRLSLRDLEDDPDGRPWTKTHSHNTEVTLAGLTYARVIEILDPYTVTFEDGQYAVNLIGANSNVADKANVNQVSIRPQNSAGLITSTAIEYGEFGGAITVDVTSSNSGTVYPVGTPRKPVNNVPDAVNIGGFRGISIINVIGNLPLGAGDNIDGFAIVGQSPSKTLLSIAAEASTVGCEISECKITGIMDGNSEFRNSVVENVHYFNGYMYKCMFNPGTIALDGGAIFYAIDCKSGVPGEETPVLDCGGAGQAIAIRGYDGGIELQNKTGSDKVSIDLASGQVKLAKTVTNGPITIRGDGKVTGEIEYIKNNNAYFKDFPTLWLENDSASRIVNFTTGGVTWVETCTGEGDCFGSYELERTPYAEGYIGISQSMELEAGVKYDITLYLTTSEITSKIIIAPRTATTNCAYNAATTTTVTIPAGTASFSTQFTTPNDLCIDGNDNLDFVFYISEIVAPGDSKTNIITQAKIAETIYENIYTGKYNNADILNEANTPITIAYTVWNSLRDDYIKAGTFGEEVNYLEYMQHYIYIDTELIDIGKGSQYVPYNNWNDAITLAENRNIKKLILYSDTNIDGLTTPNVKNFTINGVGVPVIDCLNTPDLNKSEFCHVEFKGQYSGSIIAQDCNLSGINTTLNGFFENCALSSSFEVPDGGVALIQHSSSFVSGTNPPTISVGGNTGTARLEMADHVGGIIITNCTQPTDDVKIIATGAVEITSSCIAGNIAIVGLIKPIDNSGINCNVIWMNISPESVQNIAEVLGLSNDNPVTIGNGKYTSNNIDIDVTDNANGTYTLDRL